MTYFNQKTLSPRTVVAKRGLFVNFDHTNNLFFAEQSH